MTKKGPKTQKGIEKKLFTGDGRKSTQLEKTIKRLDKNMEKITSGGKKKRG